MNSIKRPKNCFEKACLQCGLVLHTRKKFRQGVESFTPKYLENPFLPLKIVLMVNIFANF